MYGQTGQVKHNHVLYWWEDIMYGEIGQAHSHVVMMGGP